MASRTQRGKQQQKQKKPDTDCPNPLILKWLEEWRNQARQQHSKMEFVYLKALKSIREHPETLRSGQECKKLKGFGDKICALIDKKFAKEFPSTMCSVSSPPTLPSSISPKRSITDHFRVRNRLNVMLPSPEISASQPVSAPAKRNQKYVPAKGSVPFALLIGLLRCQMEFSNTKVNKLDLLDVAQLYATTNVKISGWQSINGLLQRELVAKTDERNVRYFLTETGQKLAINLARACPELREFTERYLRDDHDLVNNQDDQDDITARTAEFILESGSYEIIMCIDTRERYGQPGMQNRSAFVSALQKKDIPVEVRTLPLGDFVWIARERLDNGGSQQTLRRELVLDYIVERKRIDDLASSIKDRRWDEQKFRLRNSGIRRPMYLVEYFGKQSRKQDHGGLNAGVLDQAIANCEMDGFEVKRTENFDDTVRYLTTMHQWLERHYRGKNLISCSSVAELNQTLPTDLRYLTFNEFSIQSSKIQVFTAKEMFIKHLLLVKGLSLGKIQAIVREYPTCRALMRAYSRIPDEKERDKLLADIKCEPSIGGAQRRLGPAVSSKISQFYT